jgi:hypothetical protein
LEDGSAVEWCRAAREAIKDNRVPSRAGDRFFELSGGILYCGGCGKPMMAYNTYAGRREKRLYHYYRCPTVASNGRAACPAKKAVFRAEPLEARVWQMVSDVRKDTAWEKLLRDTFEPKVDFYRLATSDLLSRVRLTERLEKLTAKRARVLDQQSEGLITMDELKSALAAIEEERTALQDELSALDNAEVTYSQLLNKLDDLLERSRSGFFESVIMTPEQRHSTYRDMGLHVELDDDGNPVISGEFEHLFSQEGPIRR